MYALHQVGGNSFYIESPARIGLYRISGTEVCLIDSGSDKDAGRKVRQILDKYQIGFIYDVQAYLDTLEQVKEMKAAMFVPAHVAPATEIAELAQYNIDKVRAIEFQILEICKEPLCFEQILQKFFQMYGLVMNFQQYVLIGSTVRSYLSWMKESGKRKAEFADSMLLWSLTV